MKTKDIQDIIKEALGGVDSKDVSAKKPKKSNSFPSMVDFSMSEDSDALISNLANWTNKDFSHYIKRIYMKRYAEDWIPTVLNLQVYLNRVKEDVNNALGFCDNISFKDYLDFFFSNHANHVKEKSKGFLYINSLRDRDAIVEFAASYDYSQRVKFYLEKEETVVVEHSLLEKMHQSHLLGLENFVTEYGIILTTNFLHVYQDFKMKEAANCIAKALYILHTKGKWEKVAESTSKHSPYPSGLKFKKHDVILNAINKKLKEPVKLSINFNRKANDFDFLRSNK